MKCLMCESEFEREIKEILRENKQKVSVIFSANKLEMINLDFSKGGL